MKRAGIALVGALACALLGQANAPLQAAEPAADAIETRARSLGRELRCLVCQNQSIEDSDAPLAADLRAIVRERMAAGESEAQVKTFLVTRYGDFVLLQPPFKPETLLLWGLPVIGLAAGALLARRVLKRAAGRDVPETAIDLSPEERARLASLTDERGA